jgi:hypothetical protein
MTFHPVYDPELSPVRLHSENGAATSRNQPFPATNRAYHYNEVSLT